MGGILQVDTIQNNNTSNLITQTNVTTITIGTSGQNISIPSGATLTNNGTASGFGLTWQSVQTTGFTAVKGNAYPCDTTSAGFTVTLPATPSAGDQVQVVDYAGTFDTNALTIDPNGEDIEGSTDNLLLNGERSGVILTYIDSTQGWIATSGINEGTAALKPTTTTVDLLVVAGGGGAAGGAGNSRGGGGGGAGGYRTESAFSITVGTSYTLTVGGGGTGGAAASGSSGGNNQTDGSNSVFSTITSAGGGRAGNKNSSATAGGSGGSGGGATSTFNSGGSAGGVGNTPITSPSQGNNGGSAIDLSGGGGGGGSGGVGGNATGAAAGTAGVGTSNSITGSSVTYAAGGSGGANSGAGNGANANANTGNGGTGGQGDPTSNDISGGNGGSGIVIIKYPDTFTISNPGGGLTSSTPAAAGGFKVTTFTAGTGNIQLNY
jgi:hypothetical protein